MLDPNIAIEFNNVGKQYRLGLVGTGSLQHDLNRWWQTTILRREDPYLKIGEVNDRTKKAESDYVWALKDISFKVETGDVVGIIGKNGAGKSTLLKLLSHITAPSTGSIQYRGRIASLLEVGTGFHPEMTARENIYMNGSIMGMTRKEITSKLDEIIDFAGIEKYIDTPVKRFSSGMTVRLGFAVAAFLEPEILVVDEVLAVGDAEFQKKAIGKMKDVSSSGGRTVLFVSHNMASIKTLCNRGIVLCNGMQVYDGTIDHAIDFYLYESKHENNGYIIDNIRYVEPFIKIKRITVNNSAEIESTIKTNQESVNIHIEGCLDIAQKMDLIATFKTTEGIPLASFSNAVYGGEARRYEAGNFEMDYNIEIPRYVAKGDINLEVRIYEPRVQNIIEIPICSRLHFEGSMNSFCRPLNLREEGFLGLTCK